MVVQVIYVDCRCHRIHQEHNNKDRRGARVFPFAVSRAHQPQEQIHDGAQDPPDGPKYIAVQHWVDVDEDARAEGQCDSQLDRPVLLRRRNVVNPFRNFL